MANLEQKLSGIVRVRELEDMHTESNLSDGTYSEYARYQRSQPLRCANCDIEILWPPIEVQTALFCCQGCALGGPCSCDYSQYRSVIIAGVIHYIAEGKFE